ncbi:MAG TPA: hypothetical protein VHA33_17095 [Candidatus Angelobacter sp.]|jgi:hypothetical protein|nr:hypothetical protein [Candidatus Angelobacter sp.]
MHVSATTMSATISRQSLHEKINTRWHRPALWIFMIVVLAHWAEHLAQGWQVYVLGWPRHHAGGMLGMLYPWLMTTELLHYGYALIMLIGIWVLRKGFAGRSATWWTIALIIQFWHHFEHLLLIGQATFHHNLFGSPVPTSIVQLIISRIELHLFYNTIVFIPMVIGMYYHMFPAKGERHHASCNCAWHRRGLVDARTA